MKKLLLLLFLLFSFCENPIEPEIKIDTFTIYIKATDYKTCQPLIDSIVKIYFSNSEGYEKVFHTSSSGEIRVSYSGESFIGKHYEVYFYNETWKEYQKIGAGFANPNTADSIIIGCH